MNTNIVDIMKVEYVNAALTAKTRDEAIEELINCQAIQENVKDKELLLQDVMAREAQFTTKMMDFIAIPHAKTLGVSEAMVLVGKSKEGIDWRSDADFENSNYDDRVLLSFMILVPADAEGNDHLKILAMLARCLAKKDFRLKLIDETDPALVNQYVVEAVSEKMALKK